MFEALEVMPAGELDRRHQACRDHLSRIVPQAGGLIVFSRLAIYYLTGTYGNGVFWLPLEGRPVLLVRKGIERARMESSVETVVPFRSYSDIPVLCAEAGSPLSPVAAAEMNGLSWSLSGLLTSRLKDVRFLPGDMVLSRAQASKSPWELNKIRLCGARHHRAMVDLLPGRLRSGMTERQVSHAVWDVFFELGHQGIMRMGAHGEEIFLGHVSAGDSGNYPSVFNGPLGLRGEHPAVPFMGYAGKVWRRGEPLSVDCGFALEGYHTDKTQIFWPGSASSIPSAVADAHSFCMDVQAYVAEHLKPGTIPADIYAHCLEWAGNAGFAEGFMGLGGNKVPFIGHGIGLVIDAWPVLAKGFDDPFEAGMVMAVEPKMGIPGVGMVGVENTFEVTSSGGVCLTGSDFGIIALE
jgi:Xaa-Pro dipeptidase